MSTMPIPSSGGPIVSGIPLAWGASNPAVMGTVMPSFSWPTEMTLNLRAVKEPPQPEKPFAELMTKEKVAKMAAYLLAVLGALALIGTVVMITGGLAGVFAIGAIAIGSTVLQPLGITFLTASVYFFSVSTGKDAKDPAVKIAGLEIRPK